VRQVIGIARADGYTMRHSRRLPKIANLSLAIIDAILAGRQTRELSLAKFYPAAAAPDRSMRTRIHSPGGSRLANPLRDARIVRASLEHRDLWHIVSCTWIAVGR